MPTEEACGPQAKSPQQRSALFNRAADSLTLQQLLRLKTPAFPITEVVFCLIQLESSVQYISQLLFMIFLHIMSFTELSVWDQFYNKN